MLRFLRRKPAPETLAQKFDRMSAFHADMVVSTRALISELQQRGPPELLISNFSHLVGYHGALAVLRWRLGEDPRPDIAATRQAYLEMKACRDAVDPGHRLPMAAISGITDWDLIHSLFWLAGTPEPAAFHCPRLLDERYFAYSHFILCRVTGCAIPPPLAETVRRFQTGADALVDRDFRHKLALLDGVASDTDREDLIARIEANWPRRRTLGFYRTSAPLLAGHDASNDLSVDHQLACVLRVLGISRPQSPHAWQWFR